MRRRARHLFTLCVWVWGASLLVIHLAACVVILPWTLACDRDRRTAARLGSALVRWSLGVPSCWRAASRGIASVDSARPAVIVVNHRSLADIAIAVALPGAPPLTAKSWVARVPLLGPTMRLSGHLVFDPTDIGQVRDLLDRAEGLVRRGVSVVFFPEGTRRTEDGLGPFDEGAFEVAVRAGADVLPVVITGSGELVPRASLLFREADVAVIPLPRIAAGRNRGELARRTRAAMLACLSQVVRA